MASLHCAHCNRRIFLRPRQCAPRAGLCVPCGHRHAEQRSAQHAWHRFRSMLFAPAVVAPAVVDAPRLQPLRPPLDLRHLL
jgi:hypothetical protein